MKNLLFPTEIAILDKQYKNGLSLYTQEQCKISLTDKGYRIYRPPNYDGRVNTSGGNHNTWGGLVIQPLTIDSNLLVKHRTYIILFDVEGQSSLSQETFGWTNNMGWGGGGLSPNPSEISGEGIPNNFKGKKTCWYKFTITDDIYKKCTAAYAGFIAGNIYPSYRDFGFGFGYNQTGTLGTDLYITNIRMYDITNNPIVTPNKNGILKGELQEDDDISSFHISSMIKGKNFYEL